MRRWHELVRHASTPSSCAALNCPLRPPHRSEIHELPSIELQPFQVKEVLKVLMHSIIFQRALGNYRFKDSESELFDVPYVRCDSRQIDLRVEEHAEAFAKAANVEPGGEPEHVQVCISFFERRSRPGAFGLFRSEERVIWERWYIRLSVQLPPQSGPGGETERWRRQQELDGAIRRQLEVILLTAGSKKEHIPPASGLGGDDSAQWFELVSSAPEVKSGLDIFKQLLSSPPSLVNARGL